jgi:hypothetical protein
MLFLNGLFIVNKLNKGAHGNFGNVYHFAYSCNLFLTRYLIPFLRCRVGYPHDSHDAR